MTTQIREGVLRIQGYLGLATWELSHAYSYKSSAVWDHALAEGRTVPLGDNNFAIVWITGISGLDGSFLADHQSAEARCIQDFSEHRALIAFDEFDRQNPPPSPVNILPLSSNSGDMYGLILQRRDDGQYQRLGVFFVEGPRIQQDKHMLPQYVRFPFQWRPVIQNYGRQEVVVV